MSSYWEPALTAAQAAAIKDIANGTTSVPVIRPSLAAFPTLISGSPPAWTFGAWVTLAAANDLALHMMIGFFIAREGGAKVFQNVEVGTGAAGLEVVVWRMPFYRDAQAADLSTYYPVIPAVQIPANARVAARLAADNAAAESNYVAGLFIPRPIV